MKYYTVGEFAKLIGKNPQTLRKWDKRDVGSGINYNKKGLIQLVDMITDSEVERIVILYKDRLLGLGFETIENLCKKYGTIIENIDNTEKTEDQELVEDLVQIITVFSSRLQGKRANKQRK